MARVLILTQGALGHELAEAARIIAGGSSALETVTLDWDTSLEAGEASLAAALAAEPAGIAGVGDTDTEGVLILTGIPGGTPFNIASRFARAGNVEVVSGVNLPMVVRLCCPGAAERSVTELADWIQEKGRQSICRAAGEVEPAGGDSDCG